jgi:hypothetical protein
VTRSSQRIPTELLRGHSIYLQCSGCRILPTSGFGSKPPDPDGITRWCDNVRRIASSQEVAMFLALSPRDRCTAVFDGSRKFPKFRKSHAARQEGI